jgi:hypothetical protein
MYTPVERMFIVYYHHLNIIQEEKEKLKTPLGYE